ncbi:ATP-grasp domain-containing protein [Neptuniibacter sp. QD37_6]|uniref:ATP-grasp domain-containing protein n=1 Tax=Neptuniibacter sp. QD37_6 TaxID=3398210 RepID=UPI0039F52A7B
MRSILITGAGGAGAELIWKLFSDKYSLFFADADLARISRDIPDTRCVKIPFAGDDDFLQELVSVCLKLDIDLLVSAVDEELSFLAENVGLFSGTRMFMPEASFIRMMLDKFQMVEHFKANALMPITKLLSDHTVDIPFPSILKPRTGRGSRDVFVLDNDDDLDYFSRKFTGRLDDFIVQEKAEGVEYTVQVVSSSQGALHEIIPVKVFSKKGITISAETEYDQNVIAACQRLHMLGGGSGTYNIQLILSSDGIVYPFEINPRISTTFGLVLASGVDPFELFDNHSATFIGRASERSGCRLERHWVNSITHY